MRNGAYDFKLLALRSLLLDINNHSLFFNTWTRSTMHYIVFTVVNNWNKQFRRLCLRCLNNMLNCRLAIHCICLYIGRSIVSFIAKKKLKFYLSFSLMIYPRVERMNHSCLSLLNIIKFTKSFKSADGRNFGSYHSRWLDSWILKNSP